nr:unnamed protein product [Digitaria exilis]
MDVEKPSSKGHGFFGLFDWGKKSKKRLFVGTANSSPDPKNAGDGKDVDDSTPSTRSNSILEDAPSLKESSEHSCSSSVVDEEAQTRRCPTVVARLMGLDSMPAASSSESNPMPSIAHQPIQANNYDDLTGRSYGGSPHKMPGSPIDRFKMEALPPRLAKRTLPVAQYKLLSPMKNPNHISSRNAADIMEAASRIIRPGVENINSYIVHDVGHTNAVRAYNPGEIIGVQQRSQKLNEELRRRDGPASFRPPSGKPLDFIEKLNAVSSSSNTSNSKLDVIDGDYLGLLLEQKLRELTSGVRSPYSDPAKGVKVYGTSTALEDTASACETSSIASTDFDRESLQSFNDGKATIHQADLAAKSGQSFQPVKYDHDVTDRADLEQLRLSPHSTWEASISTETCSSSESWMSTNGKLLAGEEGKGYRLRRRLLFDGVHELLNVKCAYYFNAGYGSWFMGMAVLKNLSAEEVHREMTSLKVAEEWMVDELVYREMSSPLGSWVDFKMDSYQAGGDIAADLLGSLIDEVVADLLTGSFL